MTTLRFREDNTFGYSSDELAELNRRLDRLVNDTAKHLAPPETDELAFKSWLDRIAETVLANFDYEQATARLVRYVEAMKANEREA